MTFGVVAILCSTAYLAYMKASMRESKTYVAIAEDGSQQLTVKKSRWEWLVVTKDLCFNIVVQKIKLFNVLQLFYYLDKREKYMQNIFQRYFTNILAISWEVLNICTDMYIQHTIERESRCVQMHFCIYTVALVSKPSLFLILFLKLTFTLPT